MRPNICYLKWGTNVDLRGQRYDPFASQDALVEAFHKYVKSNGKRRDLARNEIVERHLRLVVKVCAKRKGKLDLDDAISIATETVIKCIDSWEIGSGSFSGYISIAVNNALLSASQADRVIPVPTYVPLARSYVEPSTCSLDAPRGFEEGQTLHDLLAGQEDPSWERGIALRQVLPLLAPIHRGVLLAALSGRQVNAPDLTAAVIAAREVLDGF